jgi:rod shape determining protein RodA
MDLVAGRAWAQERKPIRHVDLVLVTVVVVLQVAGLFLLYSATNQTLVGDGLDPFTRVNKQLITFAISGGVVVALTLFDYRFAKIYAGIVYAAMLASLVLVRIPGLGATDATGTAQRWFQIAGFQITPSEFMKIGLIVMLAAMLSEIRDPVPSLRDIVRLVGVAALPLLLVFAQPDIGTSVALVAIVVGMLIVAGAGAKQLAVLAISGAGLLFLVFQSGAIEQYQLDRIRVVVDREAVSPDVRYNIDQSLRAVGGGGVLGQGYLQGRQTLLDFVPEQHTDFIFTVAGEEFGFLGAMTILLLYALLLWRAIRIAFLSKDPFGTYLAAGIASMFAIQMFVNVGMVIGIMPITGIPLPFLSYGGSSLLASFIAIGLLENVHMRRYG